MADLCPYCNKRIRLKATCYHPVCQYEHHKRWTKQYFDTYVRKTPQTRTRISIKITLKKSEMNSSQE